jgi:hypothetical protein
MKETRNPNVEARMKESAEAGTTPQDPVGESIKRRIARWEAKYTPERMAAILGAKAERMQERYAVQAEILARVDHRVSEVTDAAGVSVMMRVWYKDFAREATKVWRTIPSSCQELEYDVIRYKWTARGLEPALLASVKAAVIELLDASGFPRKGDEPGTDEVRG